VLDVCALVCALVVAPVGVLLGVVSRDAAKRSGRQPNVVSTAAIVIGSLIAGVAVLFVLAPVLATVAFRG
jgi:peptidyl-prolyl cis-trans isomerase B (cyclophilin B)